MFSTFAFSLGQASVNETKLSQKKRAEWTKQTFVPRRWEMLPERANPWNRLPLPYLVGQGSDRFHEFLATFFNQVNQFGIVTLVVFLSL